MRLLLAFDGLENYGPTNGRGVTWIPVSGCIQGAAFSGGLLCEGYLEGLVRIVI
jgi:hypothetical protein